MLSAQGRDADARRCALRLSRADRARLGDSRHRGAIFQQGAVALDRSLGYEEERVTRRRTERLQALTAGLSGALTSGDVAAIFIQAVIDSIGADAAALSIVDDDTGQISRRLEGIPDELIEERGVSLAAERPGAKALRRRRPAYYESIEQLAADFPQSRERGEASGMQTFAFCRCGQPGRPSASRCSAGASRRASPGTTGRSSRRSPASALSRSTVRVATRRSATSRRRCSGALPETIPSMEGVRVAALPSRLVGGRRRRRLVRHADARRRQPRLRRR